MKQWNMNKSYQLTGERDYLPGSGNGLCRYAGAWNSTMNVGARSSFIAKCGV